jgi:hypothetical protein
MFKKFYTVGPRYFFDAAIFINAVFIAFDLDGGESFFLVSML